MHLLLHNKAGAASPPDVQLAVTYPTCSTADIDTCRRSADETAGALQTKNSRHVEPHLMLAVTRLLSRSHSFSSPSPSLQQQPVHHHNITQSRHSINAICNSQFLDMLVHRPLLLQGTIECAWCLG
jgi:hypothetical protein